MIRKDATEPAFRIDRHGSTAVVVCLHTHYHADCQEAFAAVLRGAQAASESGDVIVDLDGVVLLSSTALRALRGAHRDLTAAGGRIAAAGGGDLVHGVLKFAPFITHYDTLEEAGRALDLPMDNGGD